MDRLRAELDAQSGGIVLFHCPQDITEAAPLLPTVLLRPVLVGVSGQLLQSQAQVISVISLKILAGEKCT